MIRETIVTTLAPSGAVHIAPIGLIEEPEGFVIAPFRPSQTLENLRANPHAVANYTDDVLIFAGCLTGRRDWPTRPAARVPGSTPPLPMPSSRSRMSASIPSARASTARWCMKRLTRPSGASTAPRRRWWKRRSW